ncbi:MAG: protein kinase [Polyangiales bacterium]
MDPLTPSKRRGLPGLGPVDDHTDISSPPAPWDGTADEDDEDPSDPPAPRQTVETAVITPREFDLAPGTKLGEYRIEAKIGQGGMGVVFSAVHPLIGKRAAIKILKKELCADPFTVERFVDEARVVNQIGHPNIVDVFAFGEMPDGRSYFVMEWLKGETLRDRIARGSMEVGETCRVVRLLARALQAAHEKGIIHRDLKPDNVFLVAQRDEAPSVKLLDFGIAKLAHSDHRVEKTATGAIVGTPQYIAPEQAKGYAIDARADIYALGGILFELFTGRPPFVADNAMEMVAKHLMEPPVRVSTLDPSITPELDDLVLDMLAKSPDGRPSMEKVIDVLERSRDSAAVISRARAMTPAPAPGDASQPFPRLDSEPSVPGDRSSPVRRASIDGAPAVPVSMAHPVPDLRPSRPPWIALAALPVAGLIAFLIVRSVGGGSSDTPARDDGSADTVAVEPATAVETSAAPAKKVESPPTKTAAPPTKTPPPAVKDEPPATELLKPGSLATKTPPPVKTEPPPTKIEPAKPPRQVPRKNPPPPKAKLRLNIIGGGPSTDVRIDGAPATSETMLTLGSHTVEVHAKGMIPQKFTLEVGKGGVVKRVALQPKTEPKTEPAVDDGKELMLPGKLTGKKP